MIVLARWLGFGSVALLAMARSVVAFETEASAAIVVDYATGVTVMEKNADQLIPPASMSKLMTLYMVFDALETGRLTLDMKLPVSAHAVSYRGSSMFLREGERVSVEDLIRGVIVMSGNDACVVLAEALSPDGTEAGFSRLMTERGREIGMQRSVFTNSNGWPDDNHRMSARDLAMLARHLIAKFPVQYRYFAEQEFGFDERVPDNRRNRNPLLGIDIGGDGLKTGYTDEAGYGIVGSAVRGSQRVIFVLSGLDNRRLRSSGSERLVNWYFLQFKSPTLFRAGDSVYSAPVWLGREETVEVTVETDATVLMPASARERLVARVELDGVAEAPISQGTQLGELVVDVEGVDRQFRFPLIAAQTVDVGGFWIRLKTAVRFILDRVIARPAPETS